MANGFLLKRSTGKWFRVGDVDITVEQIRTGQVFLRINAPGKQIIRGELIDTDQKSDIGSQSEQGEISQTEP